MKTSAFYRVMSWYDGYWRRKHQVEKFDELLSFSFENYSGEPRVMNDGSRVEPGDRLAILHFNRECFMNSSGKPQDYIRNALRFRKLILSSLKRLANELEANEKFGRVKAFHGVSWLPPHGEKLGFVIERLPDSARNRARSFYFKLMISAFFPHIAASEKQRIQPHAYWLTRGNLLKNFAPEPANELAS